MYKLQLPCAECGNPVIGDGPLRHIECPHCQSRLALSSEAWKSLLEDAYQEYSQFDWDEGRNSQCFVEGFQVHLSYGRQLPKCPECRAVLPHDQLPANHEGPVFCSACGKRTSTHAAPDWLRQVLPHAVKLWCAATEADPNGAQELLLQPADKPVMMACLHCGAGLKITVDTPRIASCEYCSTDFYLPDPLWRRLHPVKKRIPWYVVYRR
jgi:DNA-directed RNA polymerase subunit RPC12/RpoP